MQEKFERIERSAERFVKLMAVWRRAKPEQRPAIEQVLSQEAKMLHKRSVIPTRKRSRLRVLGWFWPK